MVTHNLDAQHAIEFVQSQWPIADPNKGFVQQLHEFNIAAQQIAMVCCYACFVSHSTLRVCKWACQNKSKNNRFIVAENVEPDCTCLWKYHCLSLMQLARFGIKDVIEHAPGTGFSKSKRYGLYSSYYRLVQVCGMHITFHREARLDAGISWPIGGKAKLS